MRDAFAELATARPVTLGGAGAIPFDAICMYADRFAIDDFDEFLALIRAMDNAYLTYLDEKRS